MASIVTCTIAYCAVIVILLTSLDDALGASTEEDETEGQDDTLDPSGDGIRAGSSTLGSIEYYDSRASTAKNHPEVSVRSTPCRDNDTYGEGAALEEAEASEETFSSHYPEATPKSQRKGSHLPRQRSISSPPKAMRSMPLEPHPPSEPPKAQHRPKPAPKSTIPPLPAPLHVNMQYHDAAPSQQYCFNIEQDFEPSQPPLPYSYYTKEEQQLPLVKSLPIKEKISDYDVDVGGCEGESAAHFIDATEGREHSLSHHRITTESHRALP